LSPVVLFSEKRPPVPGYLSERGFERRSTPETDYRVSGATPEVVEEGVLGKERPQANLAAGATDSYDSPPGTEIARVLIISKQRSLCAYVASFVFFSNVPGNKRRIVPWTNDSAFPPHEEGEKLSARGPASYDL
jgi:hypothetical protein